MKLKLEVMEGPSPVSELEFEGEEGKNILVGRADPSSDAEWRLGKEDKYVSRNHFYLEIRPPNCVIRDPFSKNGTYLKRGDQPEEMKEEIFLQDGDQIRVGHSVLQVNIEAPEKGSVVTISGQHLISGSLHEHETGPQEEEEEPSPTPLEEVRCIRCGEVLEEPPSLDTSKSILDLDLMCSSCRAEVEEERARKAKQKPQKEYFCLECGENLTDKANQDGRADEFQDVALYICDGCAEKMRRKARRKGELDRDEIERYRLLCKLGEGGMGKVYQGVHKLTGRVAAVKVILPKVELQRRSFLRFQREISIMRNFQHPNLVRLFETSLEDNKTHFVSEFLPDGDLCQFISQDGKPLLETEQAVDIIAQSLVGLDYFHNQSHKYVHRDLKPENILIQRKNGEITAKLADFGLARSYEKHGGTVTRTGEYAGTWFYMPPEQITDFKGSKPPVDIYSMGVTLYYLLTAQLPLDLPAPWEVKQGRAGKIDRALPIVVTQDERIPIRKRRSDIPRDLARVVDKATRREASDRYQTAQAFRHDLLAAID